MTDPTILSVSLVSAIGYLLYTLLFVPTIIQYTLDKKSIPLLIASFAGSVLAFVVRIAATTILTASAVYAGIAGDCVVMSLAAVLTLAWITGHILLYSRIRTLTSKYK